VRTVRNLTVHINLQICDCRTRKRAAFAQWADKKSRLIRPMGVLERLTDMRGKLSPAAHATSDSDAVIQISTTLDNHGDCRKWHNSRHIDLRESADQRCSLFLMNQRKYYDWARHRVRCL
jgi:hypothetical protein